MDESKKANHQAAEDEPVLQPEELDPYEVLETFEEALRGVVRGVRAKVMPKVDADKPTMLESAAGERPITAASVALASGFALGFVVRRLTPWRTK